MAYSTSGRQKYSRLTTPNHAIETDLLSLRLCECPYPMRPSTMIKKLIVPLPQAAHRTPLCFQDWNTLAKDFDLVK